jgi:hypothetical protein
MKSKETASPGASPAGGPLLEVITELIEVSATPAAASVLEMLAGNK